MKKIFAILLALSAMAMVMNGCSGGGEDAGAADNKAAEGAKTE